VRARTTRGLYRESASGASCASCRRGDGAREPPASHRSPRTAVSPRPPCLWSHRGHESRPRGQDAAPDGRKKSQGVGCFWGDKSGVRETRRQTAGHFSTPPLREREIGWPPGGRSLALTWARRRPPSGWSGVGDGALLPEGMIASRIHQSDQSLTRCIVDPASRWQASRRVRACPSLSRRRSSRLPLMPGSPPLSCDLTASCQARRR
jgi:hypothetical protein